MSTKGKLSAAFRSLKAKTTELDSVVPETMRESSNDYEHWAPKDLIAHSAEWVRRRIQLLSDSDEAPLEGAEEAGDINRVLFEKHRKTPWYEVIELLSDGIDALMHEVDRLDEEELNAPDPHGDGKRTVWRGIAFYGIVHPLTHISQAIVRSKNPETAVQLQRAVTPRLLEIDSQPAWKAVVEYSEARILSLAGMREEAVIQYKRAVTDEPDVAKWAADDPDFDPIRDGI